MFPLPPHSTHERKHVTLVFVKLVYFIYHDDLQLLFFGVSHRISFSLWLNKSSLCICTTCSLSIHWLMGT
jgi:hypothetical protein